MHERNMVETMRQTHIPEYGSWIRIDEISPLDKTPEHQPGEVAAAGIVRWYVPPELDGFGGGWLALVTQDGRCSICRVSPAVVYVVTTDDDSIGFGRTRGEALELARQHLLDTPDCERASIAPSDGSTGWTLTREVAHSPDVEYVE